MSRELFVSSRKPRWDRLDELLRFGPSGAEEWSELASAYRALCADLATAQSQGQPRDVVQHLDGLAGRAHNALYGSRAAGRVRPLRLLAADFPRELRRQWRFFAVASLLFYGPFLVGLVGCLLDQGFALSVLPESTLAQMEQMYSTPQMDRGMSGGDAMMAGFYVRNNIGIAFRCFATGAFAGLGSVFYIAYNGLIIGTVAGYLTAVGYGGNLLAFIAGHSAWELTGVVVSGTAGLRLGWSMVVTEGRTRVGSMQAAGPVLFRLIAGATALLAVAACIEGFWSASPVPVPLKLAFGALQLVIVTLWLALGGRKR